MVNALVGSETCLVVVGPSGVSFLSTGVEDTCCMFPDSDFTVTLAHTDFLSDFLLCTLMITEASFETVFSVFSSPSGITPWLSIICKHGSLGTATVVVTPGTDVVGREEVVSPPIVVTAVDANVVPGKLVVATGVVIVVVVSSSETQATTEVSVIDEDLSEVVLTIVTRILLAGAGEVKTIYTVC
jgi:hypothetical protein